MLSRNGLVMFDRETDSLWTQVGGEAIRGKLKGTKLRWVSAVHTSWKSWKESHPGSVVLSGGPLVDSYQGYYASARTGVIPRTFKDSSLPPKTKVLGVFSTSPARAYPLEQVLQQKLLRDKELVVMADLKGRSAVAWMAGDHTFVYRSGEFVDKKTGSVWDPLSGKAVRGKLKGRKLEPVGQSIAFWFGWRDYFPDTKLWVP